MSKSNREIDIIGFVKMVHGINANDYYSLVLVSGGTGIGKSTLTVALSNAQSIVAKVPFTLEKNMTYLRSEMVEMVDGNEHGKGQLQEYSVILSDEFVSMFFKRNWYDRGQIEGVELLNKCRDRHLTIYGNMPNFWDLDSGVYPHIKFWIHVVRRGVAWVFEQDENPFALDRWRRKENEKILQKDKLPYRCKNFLFTLTWDDWTEEGKEHYYNIRNTKRVGTEGQVGKQGVMSVQRKNKINKAVGLLYHEYGFSQEKIGKLFGYSAANIGLILKI